MKWRLPDCWTVVHSNGWRIAFDVAQDGNTLVGTTHGRPGGQSAEMTGTMSGSVDGDTIAMTVYWPDASIAEYSGTVDGDGKAQGTTVDRSDRASVADWFGEPKLCAWE